MPNPQPRTTPTRPTTSSSMPRVVRNPATTPPSRPSSVRRADPAPFRFSSQLPDLATLPDTDPPAENGKHPPLTRAWLAEAVGTREQPGPLALALAEPLPISLAAPLANITPAALRHHLALGQSEDAETHPLARYLYIAATQAQAHFPTQAIRRLTQTRIDQTKAEGPHQIDTWILEHVMPEHFGPPSQRKALATTPGANTETQDDRPVTWEDIEAQAQ